MEGDIKFLQQLPQEDPLILHRSIVSCPSETPLHVGQGGHRDVHGKKSKWVDTTPPALSSNAGLNLLVSLKSLIEEIEKDDDTEMVNHKDCEGNALLHIAVAKKLIEDRHVIVVKWVPSPSNIPKIPKSLVSNKSKKSETNLRMPIRKKEHTDWLSRKRSALMAVSSLIAMVAYQAAIAPPGDALQADKTIDEKGNPLEHCPKAGTVVMAYNQGIEYGHFIIFNTLAFFSSLSIILQLVSRLPIKRRG
ncbi:hypothetical protein J1N35_035081 [Gossypium stocksii]|uniref:PGG domain-containing protein n=1 Tax=Gossypium stocksii TaxID=47602 RepID=A0A9D3UT90_9ROSI|nr:hypothetical protein J1N35_035081 [Gossypium stocksii]